MAALRLYQIDAFTRDRFMGNPAGVVTNAAGLDERQMLLIARELNNSETAFVLPAQGPDHDVQVRFFTPTTEVPVCGHATIAAHYALACEAGGATGTRRQLTGAGVQMVEAERDGDDLRIVITQNPPTFAEPLSPARTQRLAAALGVAPDELDPRCPPQFVSTGHGKLLVGLRSYQRLRTLTPDPLQLKALGADIDSKGFFAFTLDRGEHDDALTEGRMFAPAIGIAEDPVTGNANGPLGAYLVRHGLVDAAGPDFSFRARQATGDGRGGYVDVSVRVADRQPVGVRIAGHAVICFQTTLLP